MQFKNLISEELNDLCQDLKLLDAKIKTDWVFEGLKLNKMMQVLKKGRLVVN
jgi:hypothetical protein